jgi:hypothetical protein
VLEVEAWVLMGFGINTEPFHKSSGNRKGRGKNVCTGGLPFSVFEECMNLDT